MEVAVDLHAHLLAQDERASRARSLAVAAGEVGVPPELVEKAAALVDARRAAEAARRGRLVRIAAALAGVLLLAGLVAIVSWPTPAPVVVERFDGASARWSLDKNPETTASVRAVPGPDGEALAVRVERFASGADGKYHVNVDRRLELVPLDRHRTVTVRARSVPNGEAPPLSVVRGFLEGDGVRWRSPPINLTGAWQAQTLPLDAFERQERTADGFRVVGRGGVEDVRAWSLKVGHFMNPADAAGEIEIDELRFE